LQVWGFDLGEFPLVFGEIELGGLFVRFNCTDGWVFCYEALLLNGKPVPDKDLNEFMEFILEVLLDWGGSNMDPDENFYICEPEYSKTGSRRTGR